ncbi:MAG: hypothetical protein ACRCUE_20295, partial [Bosea sp. (in: a-proteobacteria)]
MACDPFLSVQRQPSPTTTAKEKADQKTASANANPAAQKPAKVGVVPGPQLSVSLRWGMPDSCRSDSERGIAQAIFFAVG